MKSYPPLGGDRPRTSWQLGLLEYLLTGQHHTHFFAMGGCLEGSVLSLLVLMGFIFFGMQDAELQ